MREAAHTGPQGNQYKRRPANLDNEDYRETTPVDATSNTASVKAGLPPGTLIHVGEAPQVQSRVSLIDYDSSKLEERTASSIEEILHFKDSKSVTWVNIDGLADIDLIDSIGKCFAIHPLVLEDILNTHQRPKYEEYGDYLYIVLKAMAPSGDDGFSVYYEQISMLVMKNMLFTFKEQHDDIFTPLKHRIRNDKGRLRNQGTDYLAYAILDSIVDQYFFLQDSLDESIESIEDELLERPTPEILMAIQNIKKELIHIRRSVSPVRDLLNGIIRSESQLITRKMHIYFRDVQDHVLRIAESIESYRDIVTNLLDIYISSISNRMNEVMKVLTIFASIFIPLTFIAGIYGMNFEYMPELKWQWAYPALWAVFITIPLIFLYFFKKKKWI